MARRHELAAERGFFRALKELRCLEKRDRARAKADEVRRGELASFLKEDQLLDELEALYPEPGTPPARGGRMPASIRDRISADGPTDLPFSVGRRR